MSTTIQRLGALGLLLATAGTGMPLLASPASALPATTEVSVFVSDTDGDGYYGIYRQEAGQPASAATAIVPESNTTDAYDVAVSADGSRIAYVIDTHNSATDAVRERLVVRDISGRIIRTLADVDGNVAGLLAPSLSPDGTTVVWTRVSASSAVVQRGSVVTGAVANVAGGANVFEPVFVDGSTLLGQTMSGAVTLPAAGGTPHTVAGLPAGSYSDVEVSPDGTHLAWSHDPSPGSATASTADVETADFALTNGVGTVSNVTQRATGQDNYSPTWSRDGGTLRYVKYGDSGPGDIFSIALTPGATATQESRTGDELQVATGLLDTAAPGDVVATPFTLAATGATLHWTLPADTDLSGVLITRKLGSTVQRSSVFVAAPSTSFADTGLVLGQTYTYEIAAVDRSGNVGTAAIRQLTTASVAASFTDPTSNGSIVAAFRVTLGSTAAGLHYYANYRALPSTTWTPWLSGVTGGSQVFGSTAATGKAATTSKPGTTYQFRTRVADAYGNSTGTLSSAAAVVPFDQVSAAFNAGRTVAQARNFLGSVRLLNVAGQYGRITVTGNRFQVIGQRCTTCGAFDVYDGRTRVATIDTRATSTQYRAVLYTRTWTTSATRTLVVKARGTSGRPNVILDAFAVRR
jgi:hypothetical protein